MIEYYDNKHIVITNGYQDIHLPTHPNCRKNGNIYVHILVAEKILGRYLMPDEVVHHIDFSRCNNDPSNLMIFDSKVSHSLYHKCLKIDLNFILYRINGVYHCELLDDITQTQRLKINGNIRSVTFCKVCGKIISRGSVRCSVCNGLNNRIVIRPTRAELKNQIRYKTFVSIAKEYNVSDNAVRKWCRVYNLPYKSSDIKKLSSEDWAKI